MQKADMFITVLPASDADVQQCAVIEECYFSEPWSAQSFAKAVADEDSLFYVVKTENTVIGYFVAGNICNEINLYTIAVDSEYRKMGVGKRLMEELLQCATQADATVVFLEVRVSNTPAIRLYEKFGFKQIGIRKGFYKKPIEDALLFALNLGETDI